MKHTFFIIFYLFVCILFSYAPLNAVGNTHDTGQLVFFKPIAVYQKDSIASSFLENRDQLGPLSVSMLFNNDTVNGVFDFQANHVTGYQIRYTTLNPYKDGDIIQASGLLLIPSFSRPLPLLLYHRGTLASKHQAPSLIPDSFSQTDSLRDWRLVTVLLAMQGYIVFVPDYLGYGSSAHIPHPYLYKKSVTRTTTDMLYAVMEKLKEESIPFQKHLFVMGYSQGGYGALAFAQNFQNESLDLDIAAVATGGGPYDLSTTVVELLEQESIEPVPMTLFLQAYSYIYGWNLDIIMKRRDYIDIISSAFQYDNIREVTKELPTKVQSLFHAEFIEEAREKGNPIPDFQNILERNSVYNWTPSFPVFLFHANLDRIVPYSNMDIAYDSFRTEEGANITKTDCDLESLGHILGFEKPLQKDFDLSQLQANHINCGFMFVLEAVNYFSHL